MPRITVFVLLLSAAAGCSRESAQQTPATSQAPPAASSANPEPAPPPPSQDAAPPAGTPAANDQPAVEEPQSPAPNAPANAPSSPSGAATVAPAPPSGGPPAPPAPRFREITVPADTLLTVTLETPVASDTSQVEDVVEGRLARGVVVSRTTVLPAGSRITGSVLDAKRSSQLNPLTRREAVAARRDPRDDRGAAVTCDAPLQRNPTSRWMSRCTSGSSCSRQSWSCGISRRTRTYLSRLSYKALM